MIGAPPEGVNRLALSKPRIAVHDRIDTASRSEPPQ
jgi:hypothetical protein